MHGASTKVPFYTMLYEKAINEGDKVYFDKDNKLEKALDET